MRNLGKVTPNWNDYVQALTMRFGEVIDDPMLELKELKQKATIKEYHNAFNGIINRADLRPQQALQMFITCLDAEIQFFVRSFNPLTIQHAYCLAKLQEATLKAMKARNNHKPPLLPPPNQNSCKKPFISNTTNPRPWSSGQPRNPGVPFKLIVTRKALTSAELGEKRSKGLCFYCDEKYEVGTGVRGKDHTFFTLR